MSRSPSGMLGSLVLERPLHADALTLALGIPEEAPVGQVTDAGVSAGVHVTISPFL